MRSVFATAVAAWACAACAAGAVELAPGKTIEFVVTGTQPSLADLKRVTNAKSVQMAVKLPDNYSPDRSFPVVIFLSGGDGGNGCELHMATPFMGGTDYILCNMPVFKQNLEGATVDEQLSVTPLDAEYALQAYRVLIDELHRLVPNIDDSRSVLGGFSNGAGSAALFLWAGDQDLLARFSSFVLVEGGFWLASDRPDPTSSLRFKPATFAGLAGKRVLVMYGAQTHPADRIPFIKDARKTIEALRQAGVDTAEMPMTDVGHDFPPEAMAKARQWVLSGR